MLAPLHPIYSSWGQYRYGTNTFGSNDIIPSKQHDLSVKDIVQRIIDIGLYCKECCVKDAIILST